MNTIPPFALSRDVVRRSLRGSIWEGVLAMPIVYLNLPGNYVLATLLAATLGFGPAAYGALVSIPFWCNFAQLFISPLLARHWPARRIFLTTAWINTVAWVLVAGVLAWIWRNPPEAPAVLVGTTLFLGCMGMAVSGVAWTTYVQSWVPQRIRGVYFAKRNRITQISNLSFLILAAAILHYVGRELPVFCGLFLGACALRVFSLMVGHATPAPGDPPAHGTDLRAQIGVLKRDGVFLRFVATGALWGFTANFVNPFYPVYLLKQLDRSAGAVGVYYVLAMLFGALAFPAWGRLINRHGSRPVLLCAIALWGVINTAWFFVSADTPVLPYVLGALAGAANAGVVLGQFNLVLKLVPTRAKSLAIGFNTAVTSLATAIAPLVGGAVIAWALGRGWLPGEVYRGFFLGLPALALVTWLVVRRLPEPDTAPLERVVGAMRNVRTLGAVLGLGFLFTYLFEPTAEITRKLGTVGGEGARRPKGGFGIPEN
ncbi:MAG TPA: MFS transporter [Opitutaceae bacterium]|nr:MFS transporter [Opitutaceae bacterium]